MTASHGLVRSSRAIVAIVAIRALGLALSLTACGEFDGEDDEHGDTTSVIFGDSSESGEDSTGSFAEDDIPCDEESSETSDTGEVLCPDPDAEGVRYVSEEREDCAAISVHCAPGWEPIPRDCGCGCMQLPEVD